MSISQHIPDHIKRVSRSLGYTLWLGAADHWFGLSAIFRARLNDEDRAGLAWATLRSLDPYHAQAVADAVLGGAGAPDAPLFDTADQAAIWAGIADDDELDAYAVAIFNALPPAKQRYFLEYGQEVLA
ncbi:hypothetical protein SAMN05443432_1198 [Roseovarius litoreus]|uniref:Uncharacterized protein n=1 Tax=Roseovarius litoreus TaxID=1155722 RepID=A0A1M7LNJ1_9RHOB|nr:hypothetical protein [Roseovarius litoreus]SHM79794.1 hypothetical protein SAMN05443432_1198 [Roseovarius litoreus]